MRHFLQGYSHIITPIIAYTWCFLEGFHPRISPCETYQFSRYQLTPTIGPAQLHPSDIRPLRDRPRESVPDPPDACGWCANSSWPPSGKTCGFHDEREGAMGWRWICLEVRCEKLVRSSESIPNDGFFAGKRVFKLIGWNKVCEVPVLLKHQVRALL